MIFENPLKTEEEEHMLLWRRHEPNFYNELNALLY